MRNKVILYDRRESCPLFSQKFKQKLRYKFFLNKTEPFILFFSFISYPLKSLNSQYMKLLKIVRDSRPGQTC